LEQVVGHPFEYNGLDTNIKVRLLPI